MEKCVKRILSLLLCIFLAPIHSCLAETDSSQYQIQIIQPTCEDAGYSIYESYTDGSISIHDEVPALGHEPGEWMINQDGEGFFSYCTRCGARMEKKAAETPLPRIDFHGSMEGISKSERILLDLSYQDEERSFSCYAYTTWQGHTSLSFPKKNYTIRLYDDTEVTQKHKLIFRQWQKEHKYVLKANYRDPSQARNLIAANIWAKMAACRPNLPEELRSTSHFGATDGFPVTVYLNDEFHGLYCLMLHIDDDLYQMKNQFDAIAISNAADTAETRFQAQAAFEDEKNAWEIEYCGTEEENQWVRDQLNDLIDFVMTSDDDAFREHLAEYMDVDGAIDYLIFIYALGLPDNASKDLVLLTYQQAPWIPTVYDMEHAFGLSRDGSCYMTPEAFLPEKTKEGWDSHTENLLWDRLLQNFDGRLRSRYLNLRRDVLTEENLVTEIETIIASISAEYYEMDLSLYPRQNTETDPKDQMTVYVTERLKKLDEAFLSGTKETD